MKHLYEALKSALDKPTIDTRLNVLVGLADCYMEQEDNERAVEILAMVLCYPLPPATRDLAEMLFSELEIMVCPRVIEDAKSRSEDMTLDDLALELLTQLADAD